MKKQKMTFHTHGECINETVICPVCNKPIGLRDGSIDGATGLAWYDPYNKTMYFHKNKTQLGCYTHIECLSEKRKLEISTCENCSENMSCSANKKQVDECLAQQNK